MGASLHGESPGQSVFEDDPLVLDHLERLAAHGEDRVRSLDLDVRDAIDLRDCLDASPVDGQRHSPGLARELQVRPECREAAQEPQGEQEAERNRDLSRPWRKEARETESLGRRQAHTPSP